MKRSCAFSSLCEEGDFLKCGVGGGQEEGPPGLCALLGRPQSEGLWARPRLEGPWGRPQSEGPCSRAQSEGLWAWLRSEGPWGMPQSEGPWGRPQSEGPRGRPQPECDGPEREGLKGRPPLERPDEDWLGLPSETPEHRCEGTLERVLARVATLGSGAGILFFTALGCAGTAGCHICWYCNVPGTAACWPCDVPDFAVPLSDTCCLAAWLAEVVAASLPCDTGICGLPCGERLGLQPTALAVWEAFVGPDGCGGWGWGCLRRGLLLGMTVGWVSNWGNENALGTSEWVWLHREADEDEEVGVHGFGRSAESLGQGYDGPLERVPELVGSSARLRYASKAAVASMAAWNTFRLRLLNEPRSKAASLIKLSPGWGRACSSSTLHDASSGNPWCTLMHSQELLKGLNMNTLPLQTVSNSQMPLYQ
jgi:hypothetical protein